MTNLDLDELAAELADFAPPEKKGGRSPREERVIAGFEEIQRFAETHGRAPQHGEDRDIFERLYAVRLDRLRTLKEWHSLLAPLDRQGVLAGAATALAAPVERMDDEELLAELEGAEGASDITELRHVRTAADKRAAEEIANRERCVDFERFRPLFDKVQRELADGIRGTRPFQDDARIEKGNWFILGGQKAYIAEEGEEFVADYGRKDRRLRVVFDNGTESTMLKRSVERALQKDEAGRRITDPVAGPLFASEVEADDLPSGTIYVLRSKSSDPAIAQHRDVLHKIGVTGGEVKTRIANAKLDPTFLLADVEIIATYKLANINRTKLENLIHRIFDPARLEIEIQDRFGNPVIPREWFLVPVFVINEAVERIKDGSIPNYRYDPKTASLVQIAEAVVIAPLRAPNVGLRGSFLYFAYGSNMLTKRLNSRAPSAVPIAVGYVEGHRLSFDKVSRQLPRSSGKCDMEHTGNVVDRVYGVVFRISDAEAIALDEVEGVGQGYKKAECDVVTGDGTYRAKVYVATSKDSSLRPFHWYKEHVVRGALEHKLPTDYVAMLRAVESWPDPDEDRVRREQAIW